MKNLILIAIGFATTATLTLRAHAGREGNGGDIVFCKYNQDILRKYPELGQQPATVYPWVGMLDVVEARVLRNYIMDLGPASIPNGKRLTIQDLMPKIEIVLARIKKFDPRREKLYRKWAMTFFDEAKIDEIDLIDIPDSNHKGIPTGCVPKQLIIHEDPKFEDEPRYVIDSNYWDKMDANHQVAAMFHEFSYREGVYLDHLDSRAARYYNSRMLSNKYKELSMASYIKLLKQTKLLGGLDKIASVNGEDYSISNGDPESLRLNDAGLVTYGLPVVDKEFQFGNLKLKHQADRAFVLADNGTQIYLATETVVRVGTSQVTLSNENYYNGVVIDLQNRILKAHLAGYNRLPTAYGSVEFIGEFVADPSGYIKFGYAWWNGGSITLADGTATNLKKGLHRVGLNSQGQFTEVSFWTEKR